MFNRFVLVGLLCWPWCVGAVSLPTPEKSSLLRPRPYVIIEPLEGFSMHERILKIRKEGEKSTQVYKFNPKEAYSIFEPHASTAIEYDPQGRVLRTQGASGEETFYMYLRDQLRSMTVQKGALVAEEMRLPSAYIQRLEKHRDPVGIYRYVGFSFCGRWHGVFASKEGPKKTAAYCFDMDGNYHCRALAYVRVVGGEVAEEQALTFREQPSAAKPALPVGGKGRVQLGEKLAEALAAQGCFAWEDLRAHLIQFAQEG